MHSGGGGKAVGRGPRAGLVAVLGAEAVSQVGTKMTFVALPWLVLVDTGSPTRMGLIAAAEMLPYVLAGVIGAPLIDRRSPWRMSIDTDLVSAVAFGAVVATYHRFGLGALAALVAVAGAARGLGDRSRAVLLRPQIEAAGVNVTRATAMYDGIGRLTSLVGVPIGGVLIAWLGSPRVIGLDAMTFALSAMLVAAFVRPPAMQPAGGQPAPEPYLRALRGGVEHLRRDRLLVGMLLMLLVTNLSNQAHQVVFIPLWVNDRLGTPAGLGLVFGSFALGAVMGNLVFTALAPRLPRHLTLTVGYLVGGAPRMLILALSDSLPVVVAVLFLAGVGLASVNPIIGAVLYQRVPAALQARVFGLTAAVAYAGLPLGSVLGGATAEYLGLTWALFLVSTVVFAATLSPVVGYRTWREMDSGSPTDVDRSGPLRVTLAYEAGQWRLSARRGRQSLVAPRAIEPAQALRHVARLELPEALVAAEEIVSAQRDETKRRAEALRAELSEVEARLAALDGVPPTGAPALDTSGHP